MVGGDRIVGMVQRGRTDVRCLMNACVLRDTLRLDNIKQNMIHDRWCS